jgi:hypothetical protein
MFERAAADPFAMRLLAVPLALVALAAAAPAAAAKECSRSATVTAGTVQDLRQGTVGPDGVYTLDGAPAERRLSGRALYATAAAATLSYEGVTYRLAPRTVFGLSCFGHSRKEGARFPALELRAGRVAVTSEAGRPGAVSANEGLWDPYRERAMRFSVTRTAKGAPSFARLLREGPSVLQYGTARVRKTGGDGYLNITPYVGRGRGVCRQAKGGRFVSKRLVGGYFEGTSRFDGLAPFSPRP